MVVIMCPFHTHGLALFGKIHISSDVFSDLEVKDHWSFIIISVCVHRDLKSCFIFHHEASLAFKLQTLFFSFSPLVVTHSLIIYPIRT